MYLKYIIKYIINYLKFLECNEKIKSTWVEYVEVFL